MASLSVSAVGPFGGRVGDLIAADWHAGVRHEDDPDQAFQSDSAAVVVALWRPDPSLCDRADELAFAHEKPWLPVTMEHPVAQIGPLVRADGGPCYRCYHRRLLQHDDQRQSSVAVYEAYENNPGLGPRGYLPHHARLAAGAAIDLLQRGEPGVVITVELLKNKIHANPVIAYSDCGRCGAGPPSDRVTRLTEILTSVAAGREQSTR